MIKIAKKKKSITDLNYKGFWTKSRAKRERALDKKRGYQVSRIIHTPGAKSGDPSKREQYGYISKPIPQYWCQKCRKIHYANSKIGKSHKRWLK